MVLLYWDSKPDVSFMAFLGVRYICMVYNNPLVANSVILMIYCCRVYNFYKQLFFKFAPKNRSFCINIGIWIQKKNARDHGIVSPTQHVSV
jgi:hypothetical protein